MTSSKGKVGAPFGNKNAIKHGLYSQDRQLDFSKCHREGIQTEIDYIRVVMDYVMKIIPTLENPDQVIRSLSSVATSTVKLSYLLQSIAKSSNQDVYNSISIAIKEVHDELVKNVKR